MKQHPDGLYSSRRTSPAPNRSPPDAEAVTQWLSNFHIVVTE